MKAIGLLLMAMLLVVVIGCENISDTATGGHLDGTQWKLTGWTLSSLNPADFTITAKFSDGQISGNSGVNTYSGPYDIGSGSALSVGPLAGTEMAGSEPAMRAETAYLTLLGQVKSYKMTDGKLTLYDNGGNESLIFEATRSEKNLDATADIVTVKERHEAELMAIPGVVGVGIGERDGTEVIVVYVEKRTAQVDREVSDTLEGYPVFIEVTGPINAL